MARRAALLAVLEPAAIVALAVTVVAAIGGWPLPWMTRAELMDAGVAALALYVVLGHHGAGLARRTPRRRLVLALYATAGAALELGVIWQAWILFDARGLTLWAAAAVMGPAMLALLLTEPMDTEREVGAETDLE